MFGPIQTGFWTSAGDESENHPTGSIIQDISWPGQYPLGSTNTGYQGLLRSIGWSKDSTYFAIGADYYKLVSGSYVFWFVPALNTSYYSGCSSNIASNGKRARGKYGWGYNSENDISQNQFQVDDIPHSTSVTVNMPNPYGSYRVKSIRITEDGNTISVFSLDSYGSGTVYIYQFSSLSALWTYIGSIPCSGNAAMMDMSDDGTRIVVLCGVEIDINEVTYSSGSFTYVANHINLPLPTTGNINANIALSGDGKTMAVGIPGYPSGPMGKVYVWVYSGGFNVYVPNSTLGLAIPDQFWNIPFYNYYNNGYDTVADDFGSYLALSTDGDYLSIGFPSYHTVVSQPISCTIGPGVSSITGGYDFLVTLSATPAELPIVGNTATMFYNYGGGQYSIGGLLKISSVISNTQFKIHYNYASLPSVFYYASTEQFNNGWVGGVDDPGSLVGNVDLIASDGSFDKSLTVFPNKNPHLISWLWGAGAHISRDGTKLVTVATPWLPPVYGGPDSHTIRVFS